MKSFLLLLSIFTSQFLVLVLSSSSQEYSYGFVLEEFPKFHFPSSDLVGLIRINDFEKRMHNLGSNLKRFEVGQTQEPSELSYQMLTSIQELGRDLTSIKNPKQEELNELAGLTIDQTLAWNMVMQISSRVPSLGFRIKEMINSSVKIEERRLSVIPAMNSCEVIARLFGDEHFITQKYKTIFTPYLLTFAALYSTVGQIGAQLLPQKRAHLKVEMERLKTLVEAYQGDSIRGRQDLVKSMNLPLKQVKMICPAPPREDFELYWEQNPLDWEHFTLTGTGCVKGLPIAPSGLKEGLVETPGGHVHVFKDEVSGDLYCGWDNCLENLQNAVKAQINDLFEAAYKIIPDIPPMLEKSLKCKESYINFRHREGYGCHKGYCWSYCSLLGLGISRNWCYTKNEKKWVKCKRDDDCCPEWRCGGPCSIFK